jgi:hypothetical protein
MKKAIVLLFCSVFFLSSFIFSQSNVTGALKGTLTLEDGNPVAGVYVKVKGKNIVLERSTITNEEGKYRFVGLPPAVYTLSASLEGFTTAVQTGIKIAVGKTFTIDLQMKQGTITEEIVVVGKKALVDVKDSATASVDLTTEYLQNIPNSQFSPDIVNLAPGITSDVAYGASDGTGIAYHIDGVDVSDPAGGTAWVFLDYNLIEEVSVSGIGAPAEYGQFSGVIFNTVTKSGGNELKLYSEILYQGNDWNSSNSDDPDFAPSETKFYSAHLDIGGPIIKDKLSFFASGLYYREITKLSGTTYNRDYQQPKIYLKLSLTSPKSRTNASVFYEEYNGSGRDGGALTAEEATVNQEGPGIVGTLSHHYLLSDTTFLEAKLSYFWGYYYLNPFAGDDISGHYDGATSESTVNATYFNYNDRWRLTTDIALTHHSDDFIKGSHDFKFGAQYNHNRQRDRYGYSNGVYYYDWYGEPYYRCHYEGYDWAATMNTLAVYFQDSWSISDRLTINPGVRMDYSWGGVNDLPGSEVKTYPAIAPRIGFSFDILGDHTTALKAHWGRYFEGSWIYAYTWLSPNISDKTWYWWDGSDWIMTNHWPGGKTQYEIHEKLHQQYMDQWTVGIERELGKDISLSLTYIDRRNYNHIAPVLMNGQFIQVEYTNEFTGETFQLWQQTNDPAEDIYYITNPKKGDLPWMTLEPRRKYTGIEALLNKRFSNKWQLMVSYVYSKATGNFNNTMASGSGYNYTFHNPNNQIYSDGKLTNDYTHMLKIQGSVILPLDLHLNMNFSLISGQTYTMWDRLGSAFNRASIYLEPRGSNREPTSKNLDVRIEKTFNLGKTRLGLMLDIFNVFNQGIVTSYSSLDTSFEEVLAISRPRAFRAGVRLWW